MHEALTEKKNLRDGYYIARKGKMEPKHVMIAALKTRELVQVSGHVSSVNRGRIKHNTLLG